MLRTSHSVRVGIAAVIALVISAGCGGGAGSDEAASDDGNDRDVIVADIYDFWAESSAATAESLDLALADVVDRACIADAVAQFSDADAALLVARPMVRSPTTSPTPPTTSWIPYARTASTSPAAERSR